MAFPDTNETLREHKIQVCVRRSLTIDFLRGFAIWMMIVLHNFQHLYDVKTLTDPDYLLTLPVYIILPVIFLAYLGSWAGLFLLISMSANVIAFDRRIQQGVDITKLRNRQLMNGFAILVIAFITEMFTTYAGLAGNLYTRRKFEWFNIYRGLFNWETLNAVGLSIVITSLLLHRLYKDGGDQKVGRNIGVLAVLSFLVIALEPVVNYLIRRFIYLWWTYAFDERQYKLNSQTNFFSNNVVETLFRIPVIALNGHLEPLFPFLGTAFVGTIFGIVLSQEVQRRSYPKYGILFGLALIGLALFMAAFGFDPMNVTLGFRPDSAWYLLGLGGQVLTLSVFLYFVEYRGNTVGFKKISRYWRRWGMLALTIYAFQPIDIPLREFIHVVFGLPTNKNHTLNEFQTLFVTIMVLIYLDIILRLWSRVNFKYSWEWIIVNLFSRKTGIKSERLNIVYVIDEVEPLDFSAELDDTPVEVTVMGRKVPAWAVGVVLFLLFAAMLCGTNYLFN
ncbi:MAG: DUF1624 domain-containing protein [Gammaproteobacteria bacterium]|nr:MAG: DUF1624 domain-containing protein [Gammaproteobacteria bacterium]